MSKFSKTIYFLVVLSLFVAVGGAGANELGTTYMSREPKCPKCSRIVPEGLDLLDHWYEGEYYEPWEVWQHARTDKWYCPYCAVTFIFYHYWEECTIVKEEGEGKYTGYFEMIDAWTHWARIKVNCLVCKTEGMTILEPEEHWDPWTCPCIPQ